MPSFHSLPRVPLFFWTDHGKISSISCKLRQHNPEGHAQTVPITAEGWRGEAKALFKNLYYWYPSTYDRRIR